MIYANELITCGHCGHPITGERKFKQARSGERSYAYYRCAYYNVGDHPSNRIPEGEFDRQVLTILQKMRIDDGAIRDWFRAVLQTQTRGTQQDSLAQRAELERQSTLLIQQQDRLLKLRIADNATMKRSLASKLSFAIAWRESSCNLTSWTGHTTRRVTWPRRSLNFRKSFR